MISPSLLAADALFFSLLFWGAGGVRPCALRCKGVDQQLSPGFNLRIRSVRVVVEAAEGKNDTDGGGEGGIGEVLYTRRSHSCSCQEWWG